MPDNPRVRELLDELIDREATPEEVCSSCPELLPAVRERWQQICEARAELDAIFPVWPRGLPPTIPPEQLPLPQVPGYEVEAVLGHGGMGVVFRARHLRLGRLVALKMTLAGSYAGPRERGRFRREAEAVAALRHANIVQLYDVGDWAGRPYFTMELIEGGSLAQKLAGAPQPARQSAALVATLAEAMHTAHQVGIVHRDLKPANILFGHDGTPKITDFGLARRLEGGEGLTLSGVPLGTPSYMAPEQARGQSREVGPAVDVYALGAILYELLTGRPPFRAETPAETVLQAIDQEPVPPARLNPKVPRDLETICLKCLQKESRRRYATALALADDLTRFGEGRPIQARPQGWVERSWRWSRRNQAAAALIATGIALVALVIGGGFWLERERAERRAEMARQEEREAQAVEAALEQASALERQDRWPDARAALDGALRQVSRRTPAKLEERLMRARSDANMAAKLEEIRLRLSPDPSKTRETAPTLYSDAFRRYFNVDLLMQEPAEAAARVGSSAIRDTLLAYLHDWHYWAFDLDRAKLNAVLDCADDDPWRRAFREAIAVRDANVSRNTNTMAALAALPGALEQPSLVLSGLGGILLVDGRREDALALLRESQQRHPEDFWLNYLLGQFWEKASPPVAVGYFRAAVALRPNNDEIYRKLGRALLETGDAEGAIAALRNALVLNPNVVVVRDLAKALAPRGGLEEARGVWEKILERDPPDPDSWYGYAHLCLFVGNKDAYARARQALLARFGDTADDWIVAERTSLACLLLPDSGDGLRRATRLADLAVAAAERSSAPGNPFVQFVKGLALYRQGRSAEAIPVLREVAEKLSSRAGVWMALAMAQFQSGSAIQARKTLAAGVRVYDWDEPRTASDPDQPSLWASHVLRREAEALILPNLPAFLEGKYLPEDNDERIALLGICLSRRLSGAAARLYADAFAADPSLADGMTNECFLRASQGYDSNADPTAAFNAASRYLAARCAAVAGCGLGKDGEKLTEAERSRWRAQACAWLRADLAMWVAKLNGDSPVARDLARRMLTRWQTEPDLAGLREPARLKILAADERKGCLDLWTEVGTVLARRMDAL